MLGFLLVEGRKIREGSLVRVDYRALLAEQGLFDAFFVPTFRQWPGNPGSRHFLQIIMNCTLTEVFCSEQQALGLYTLLNRFRDYENCRTRRERYLGWLQRRLKPLSPQAERWRICCSVQKVEVCIELQKGSGIGIRDTILYIWGSGAATVSS
jgi:hypothetical protein